MSSTRRLASNTAVESAPELSKHEQHEQEPWAEEERQETAQSIKAKQNRMEEQVLRIWTYVHPTFPPQSNSPDIFLSVCRILSAFEESSAACISDMLRHVSDREYLDAIRNAEKFILHVEVLFATIDGLEYIFSSLGVKGASPHPPFHRSPRHRVLTTPSPSRNVARPRGARPLQEDC
jgi:hypothetical protein